MPKKTVEVRVPVYYRIRLEFITDILGGAPMSKSIYTDYIASKAPEGVDTQEEILSVADLDAKGTTGFLRHEGRPMLSNHVIKGFLKEACGALRGNGYFLSADLTAYKTAIDTRVFVAPRLLEIQGPEGFDFERPLRCDTARGPRVAMARSQMMRADAVCEFYLRVIDPARITAEMLAEWLDYGYDHGIGQWRSANWGQFVYEILPATEDDYRKAKGQRFAAEELAAAGPREQE